MIIINIILFAIYLLVTILLGILSLKYKINKIILFIYGILFSLLISTRSLDVPDTTQYVSFYRNVFEYRFSIFNYSSFEIGYSILNLLVSSIFGEFYQALFFIISFINFSLIYYSSKKIFANGEYNKKVALSIIIFTTFFGIYYSAIVLRQSISFSLMYSAIGYINQKKFTKSIIISLLAVSFHSSAIIVFIILIIYKYSRLYSKFTYLVLLVLITFIYYSQISLLIGTVPIINFIKSLPFVDYSKYFNLIEYSSQNSNWIFFLLASGYFFAFFIKIQHKNIFNIYIVGLSLLSLFRGISILLRVTDYFMFFSIVLFSYSIFEINKLYMRVFIFLSIIFSNLYVIVNILRNYFY